MNEPPTNTNWTEVLRTRTEHPGRRRAALEVICKRYWLPVYSFLVRKYGDRHRAEDLTQGFFIDVVVQKELVQQADPGRGKLRTLLLTALERYARSEHRRELALKRQPPGGVLSLEDFASGRVPDPVAGTTPEQAYQFTWAATLLAETTAAVKQECLQKGQAKHWEIFYARLLRPIYEGVAPVAIAELEVQYQLSEDNAVSNICATLERKYERVLREQVRRTLGPDADVDAEIAELKRICGEYGASQ